MQRIGAVFMTLSVAATALALTQGDGKAVVVPKAELKWTDAGVPGVSIAVVDGDTAKGPSHFFLKYPVGLTTPLHHHSADHYVTTLSGTLLLTAGGKEHKLTPGSYFALLGKEPHVAKVDGKEPCVMFIDARGPWDVVPDKQ
jgi:quercetin dioxygenase-like cupin family protein